MSFFSSLIKAIFVISFAFPLYSEAGLFGAKAARPMPECVMNEHAYLQCTGEHDPVCATDGQTYYNPCVFCAEMTKINKTFKFVQFGYC